MLVQNETGVLPGSERFYNELSADTIRLFYYIGCCGHYFCERGYRIARTGIDQLILMYIEKGTMTAEYDGQHYTAHAGDVLLIDCTRYHYYDTPDYAEFYWLFFGGLNSFEMCSYLIHGNGAVFRTQNNAKIGVYCRYILSKFSTHQPLQDSEHSSILHTILCDLMPNTQPLVTEQTLSPAHKAVQYIRSHLSEPITLKDIARQIDYSPSHLIRLFQQEFGRTPHEYLIFMRIDHAKHLLKTTSLPIKVISSEVGYRTESGFTNAFTEKVGVSPRQFRELPLG